jgi:hypothetical protein
MALALGARSDAALAGPLKLLAALADGTPAAALPAQPSRMLQSV